ncbi:MAG: hypothetical protein IJ743_01960 [Bacilli bacterium]|nr:hypothetical protein [Bacilli bacterium]
MNRIDTQKFFHYLLPTMIFIIVISILAASRITQARYETDTNARVLPSIAFFVVGVESQNKQIKLESMVPRTEPYLYSFEVSNFNDSKKANVDLTYSIEIITTTNMPLNYKVYKGTVNGDEIVDEDFITTDENGVYYRHFKIDGVSEMNYQERVTDTYILWVEFPLQYKNNPIDYAGIIDLVDIKINAEQVV